MVRIKICGLFREEDIAYANEAAPDYTGFVFAKKSRRVVSPARAAALRKKLRGDITPVGVFVNADVGEISGLYEDRTIGMVQLHGGETDEYIRELRNRCDAPLIRALNVEQLGELSKNAPDSAASAHPVGSTTPNLSLTEYLLIDNGSGGTGESFDWSLLRTLRDSESGRGPEGIPPIFLAGGIGLHNIDAALAYNPFCVDVSSGAESGGVKDREKMIRLVERVRAYTDADKGKGN
jgi:phosphoribosylanthranilate isomerase